MRRRKVVIVGAGPGGMEAARVAAERGHEVMVFEANDGPGGQVRLAAQSPRRREMMGIIDWRYERCQSMGVSFRFNTYAGVDEVLGENPEVVIIATGGLPNEQELESGNELAVTGWDILSGQVKPGRNVLVYDDAGDHTALQAAEMIAATGASVEFMTPDRALAPEVMAMNLVPYMRSLQTQDVRFSPTFRLVRIRRDGDGLIATVSSDYTELDLERRVDQVVVNFATLPLDELYFDLKPYSSNLGAVDYGDLIAGKAQSERRNTEGRFQLFRIGDAVAQRNTHAAIYDALRFVKNL